MPVNVYKSYLFNFLTPSHTLYFLPLMLPTQMFICSLKLFIVKDEHRLLWRSHSHQVSLLKMFIIACTCYVYCKFVNLYILCKKVVKKSYLTKQVLFFLYLILYSTFLCTGLNKLARRRAKASIHEINVSLLNNWIYIFPHSSLKAWNILYKSKPLK